MTSPPLTDTTYPDESTLIKGLRQGRESAYRCLVKGYQNRLISLAYGITLDREESLDIVQDVFLSVHRNIGTFREEAGLMTWLRKITVNHCLNWKRRWKRRFRWHHQPLDRDLDPGEEQTVIRNEASPESHYLDKETAACITRAVTRLPHRLRVVFILKNIEHLSYEEIAQVLGIKPGTVSSRLYHARKQLMEMLDV